MQGLIFTDRGSSGRTPARAEAMAARLDSLACHITSRQLNHVEAAELLRVTAEAIQNEAQEIH